jgi:hypothetical protein
MRQHEEREQHFERGGRTDEEVDGDEFFDVLFKKRSPCCGRQSLSARFVLLHG